MTNPYGNDPGAQPQGLGTPGSQGPQFVAPGQYGPPQYGPPQYGPPQSPPAQPAQPYGQPGPYGPYGPSGPYGAPGSYPPPAYGARVSSAPQYGQSYQQPPYGPGYPPASQPPRRRSSSMVIVLVVLLALVAGIAFAGYTLYQGTRSTPVTQSTPSRPAKATAAVPSVSGGPVATQAPRSTDATCISGDKVTTSDFVATVPANWSCDGDDGDISISSTRNDAIWVEHDDGTGDLAADCKSQVEDLGIVGELPKEAWGGKTAVAFRAVNSGDIFGVRCAVVGTQTWYLMYFPLDSKDDGTVRADVTTLMKTWAWK